MATIRKRGNSYQIRVSAGYDSTGRQIEKSLTWTPTPNMTARQIEKELARQAVLFEEKVATGQFLDGNITFAEFADRWFKDYAEKQLKETSIVCYRDLMHRITAAIGHIKLCKLQPHHLMEFYNNLAESGIRRDTKYKACENLKDIITAAGYKQKTLAAAANVGVSTLRACCNGQNVSKETAARLSETLKRKDIFIPQCENNTLSSATIAKYHRIISSILTAAVQWQVIPSNPCQRVKPPLTEYNEAKVLDETQVAELVSCLNSEPIKYQAAVMLILYTGLRRGELCGLEWSDIDLKSGILRISKAVLYTPTKGIYEDTPKSKRSNRAVQIPPDMIKLLKLYEVEQSKLRLAIGDLWQGSDKIFTSDFGGIMNPDYFSTWFKGFLKRHNLPNIHIHTLRHTSATLLIANGVDVATVSNRLGHANTSTTLNIYTHAIKSADEAAAAKLQNILNPSVKIQTG